MLNKEEMTQKIGSLEDEKKSLKETIISLENSLSPFKEAVHKLQEKYEVPFIRSEIKARKDELNTVVKNIQKLKFRYILECTHEAFERIDKKHRDSFWKKISYMLGVSYYSDCHYIEFETFYKDFVEEDIEDIDLVTSDQSVCIRKCYMFRGELDDAVRFEVSKDSLENLPAIIRWLTSYVKKYEEDKVAKEEARRLEAERADYEQYLRLKAKFDKEE